MAKLQKQIQQSEQKTLPKQVGGSTSQNLKWGWGASTLACPPCLQPMLCHGTTDSESSLYLGLGHYTIPPPLHPTTKTGIPYSYS